MRVASRGSCARQTRKGRLWLHVVNIDMEGAYSKFSCHLVQLEVMRVHLHVKIKASKCGLFSAVLPEAHCLQLHPLRPPFLLDLRTHLPCKYSAAIEQGSRLT